MSLASLEKSKRDAVKWPTRGSASRGRIGSSGSFAKLYWKPRNRLRGSGSVVGTEGTVAPGLNVAGGCDRRDTA